MSDHEEAPLAHHARLEKALKKEMPRAPIGVRGVCKASSKGFLGRSFHFTAALAPRTSAYQDSRLLRPVSTFDTTGASSTGRVSTMRLAKLGWYSSMLPTCTGSPVRGAWM